MASSAMTDEQFVRYRQEQRAVAFEDSDSEDAASSNGEEAHVDRPDVRSARTVRIEDLQQILAPKALAKTATGAKSRSIQQVRIPAQPTRKAAATPLKRRVFTPAGSDDDSIISDRDDEVVAAATTTTKPAPKRKDTVMGTDLFDDDYGQTPSDTDDSMGGPGVLSEDEVEPANITLDAAIRKRTRILTGREVEGQVRSEYVETASGGARRRFKKKKKQQPPPTEAEKQDDYIPGFFTDAEFLVNGEIDDDRVNHAIARLLKAPSTHFGRNEEAHQNMLAQAQVRFERMALEREARGVVKNIQHWTWDDSTGSVEPWEKLLDDLIDVRQSNQQYFAAFTPGHIRQTLAGSTQRGEVDLLPGMKRLNKVMATLVRIDELHPDRKRYPSQVKMTHAIVCTFMTLIMREDMAACLDEISERFGTNEFQPFGIGAAQRQAGKTESMVRFIASIMFSMKVKLAYFAHMKSLCGDVINRVRPLLEELIADDPSCNLKFRHKNSNKIVLWNTKDENDERSIEGYVGKQGIGCIALMRR